jgi:hypothetical protein
VSAAEVALMVTDWLEVIELGAVYTPAVEIVPTVGLRLQLTDVFVVPLTVGVKDCVFEAVRLTVPGVSEIETGGGAVVDDVPARSVMDAYAYFVRSAIDVALTLTVVPLAMEAGAV